MNGPFFPPIPQNNGNHSSSIGYVVGGGLKENLHVRLTVPAQEVQEGSFVIINSGDWRFYGLVTDLHYADRPSAGTRYYRETPAKLAEAVERFTQDKIDLMVELGDLVDAADSPAGEMGYLRRVVKDLAAAPGQHHYVIGNHCVYTLTKALWSLGGGVLLLLTLYGRRVFALGVDGALSAGCAGTVFNEAEVRAELQQHGHSFAGDSAAQLILHGYRQWGMAAWPRFAGMYAAAVWDEPARRLVLARDPLGFRNQVFRKLGAVAMPRFDIAQGVELQRRRNPQCAPQVGAHHDQLGIDIRAGGKSVRQLGQRVVVNANIGIDKENDFPGGLAGA